MRFLDPSGAATVHVLGGACALAVIWIAGPRKGKFPREGLATAMPGHNAPYVLFGCLLALVGWLAWNAAGAVLWMHAGLTVLAVSAVNTILAAAGALLRELWREGQRLRAGELLGQLTGETLDFGVLLGDLGLD